MTSEIRKYHHSTQNRKLHRTVSLRFFRKKRPSHFVFIFQADDQTSEDNFDFSR